MSGDVFRMSSWTHRQVGLSLGYKTTDKKKVAVMLHLGEENKDETEPLDLEAAMNKLGWFRKVKGKLPK